MLFRSSNSSSEEFDIDVESITDRIVEEEFDSETERKQFLGSEEPTTNLSEHGDSWRSAGGPEPTPEVESDD